MLNLNNIRQISAGDEAFVKGVLQVYLTKEKEYSTSLIESLKAKNYEDLRQIVHKIKSSVSVLGMSEFRAQLNTFEKALENNLMSDDEIASNTEKVEAEFARSLQVVRDELTRL